MCVHHLFLFIAVASVRELPLMRTLCRLYVMIREAGSVGVFDYQLIA